MHELKNIYLGDSVISGEFENAFKKPSKSPLYLAFSGEKNIFSIVLPVKMPAKISKLLKALNFFLSRS